MLIFFLIFSLALLPVPAHALRSMPDKAGLEEALSAGLEEGESTLLSWGERVSVWKATFGAWMPTQQALNRFDLQAQRTFRGKINRLLALMVQNEDEVKPLLIQTLPELLNSSTLPEWVEAALDLGIRLAQNGRNPSSALKYGIPHAPAHLTPEHLEFLFRLGMVEGLLWSEIKKEEWDELADQLLRLQAMEKDYEVRFTPVQWGPWKRVRGTAGGHETGSSDRERETPQKVWLSTIQPDQPIALVRQTDAALINGAPTAVGSRSPAAVPPASPETGLEESSSDWKESVAKLYDFYKQSIQQWDVRGVLLKHGFPVELSEVQSILRRSNPDLSDAIQQVRKARFRIARDRKMRLPPQAREDLKEWLESIEKVLSERESEADGEREEIEERELTARRIREMKDLTESLLVLVPSMSDRPGRPFSALVKEAMPLKPESQISPENLYFLLSGRLEPLRFLSPLQRRLLLWSPLVFGAFMVERTPLPNQSVLEKIKKRSRGMVLPPIADEELLKLIERARQVVEASYDSLYASHPVSAGPSTSLEDAGLEERRAIWWEDSDPESGVRLILIDATKDPEVAAAAQALSVAMVEGQVSRVDFRLVAHQNQNRVNRWIEQLKLVDEKAAKILENRLVVHDGTSRGRWYARMMALEQLAEQFGYTGKILDLLQRGVLLEIGDLSLQTISLLLDHIESAGVHFWTEDDRLSFEAALKAA